MPTEQQPAGTNPALSTQCETMRTTNDATKPTRSDDHVSTVAQAGVIATNPVGSAGCEAIATRVHPQPTSTRTCEEPVHALPQVVDTVIQC